MSEQTCTLPRKPQIVDLHPWETVLDIEQCDRTEFFLTLHEHEAKKPDLALRPDTWPDDVVRRIYNHMAEWIERHPQRSPKAVTYGILQHESFGKCCVAVLHHAPKKV